MSSHTGEYARKGAKWGAIIGTALCAVAIGLMIVNPGFWITMQVGMAIGTIAGSTLLGALAGALIGAFQTDDQPLIPVQTAEGRTIILTSEEFAKQQGQSQQQEKQPVKFAEKYATKDTAKSPDNIPGRP